jgi:hypothetical protein
MAMLNNQRVYKKKLGNFVQELGLLTFDQQLTCDPWETWFMRQHDQAGPFWSDYHLPYNGLEQPYHILHSHTFG